MDNTVREIVKVQITGEPTEAHPTPGESWYNSLKDALQGLEGEGFTLPMRQMILRGRTNYHRGNFIVGTKAAREEVEKHCREAR